MPVNNKCPAPTLRTGEELQGFRVIRVEKLPDRRITAYELEHVKTGAKVLHLHCDERENLYAIGFRTPPNDSTGVPHIIEHSVLAGSENFPLKDAFNELLKGTLQTFINAFTYPDKTIYPVASQVRVDFYNLARVYTDLVLRPRLLKETFYQEGHHLEFNDPADPGSALTVSGIVYNEMKGAYSSPDRLMYKAIQETIFPDNAYCHDSGGDPDVIPMLTYEQFKEFHRTFYSPSNARIFLYGDIPTAEHLSFLAGMLAGFAKVEVESSIKSQGRWQEPVQIRNAYPINKSEAKAGKAAVNCAWLLAENTDFETSLLLKIVCALLVGSSAGPLRKALIDSRLGEDLSPVTGLDQDFRQMIFTVGLRGTDPDKASAIESLILETLQSVYRKGFDPELIEATLHRVEFHGKEIVRSSMPYGIVLMDAAYHTWLYDGDPLAGLNFSRAIALIRRKMEANPRIFQETLKKWLADNRHRVTSILEPSETYHEEREAAFRKKMDELEATLSEAERKKIIAETDSLLSFQASPDAPEAAATLPTLEISDLARDIDTIPIARGQDEEIAVLRHDIFTNGIAYLDIAFDVSHLPEELQVYLPLLGKLAGNMGAAGLDYEEMAKKIALKTGGISCHLTAGATADGSRNWQKMIFQVKALYRNLDEAVKIVRDILMEGDLSDRERMWDLIAEKKNDLHASVVHSGHIFARRTAAAALSLPAYRDEQWHGREQLAFLTALAGESKSGLTALEEKLAVLRALVFRRDGMTMNLTADEEGLSALTDASARLRQLPKNSGTGSPAPVVLKSPVNRGIALSAQVSYVAKAFQAPPFEDPGSGALSVAARLLSNDYLYKQIRVQGGAYGGMCQYDPSGGIFAFMSYRDPHIGRTLKVYSEAPQFLKKQNIDASALKKAVIGTIGSLDKPMDPATRGYVSMIRNFAGLHDDLRLALRRNILEMTVDKLTERAGKFIAAAEERAVVAVYGEESRLKKANEEMQSSPLQVEGLT